MDSLIAIPIPHQFQKSYHYTVSTDEMQLQRLILFSALLIGKTLAFTEDDDDFELFGRDDFEDYDGGLLERNDFEYYDAFLFERELERNPACHQRVRGAAHGAQEITQNSSPQRGTIVRILVFPLRFYKLTLTRQRANPGVCV